MWKAVYNCRVLPTTLNLLGNFDEISTMQLNILNAKRQKGVEIAQRDSMNTLK